MTKSLTTRSSCSRARPIDQAALIRHVRAAEDGAVVTFDGCVRNHSHGRRTLYLDYEAYESMALGKIREIAGQIHEKFPIHLVAIAHRLGRLEIGETSVFIAVSSPAPAGCFRRMPLRDRHPQAHCSDLEEGIFRGRRGVGRRRDASRSGGDTCGETCILVDQ